MPTNESQLIETAVLPKEELRRLSDRAGKNILFLTNTTEYGGTEIHLLELVRRLRGPDVQISIVVLGVDFLSQRVDPDQGVEVIRCQEPPKSLWDWIQFFRAHQPNVVVFVYGWLYAISWKASVGAWFAGTRRLYAIHQLIPPPVPPKEEIKSFRDLLRRLIGKRVRDLVGIRLSAHLFGKTICVSNAVRDSLERDYGFPAKRSVTIYNGVSLSRFAPSERDEIDIRAKLGLRSEEFVLVCAARLSKEKGIDILLQAISQLLRRNLSCQCIIVGDGYLKESLLEQVRELGLSNHVFLEGFQKDVKPYLLAGDAFVLTSHREGLPLAVLEAMACGLPCVVTNVGGNAEAVIHNLNGLVVNAGSVDEVVEAISYLLTHPQERAQMSERARSKAREFDMDTIMTNIQRIILN
jgi:glycosyltransferase involved in cell wall biosynthesis